MNLSFPNVIMGLIGIVLGIWIVAKAYYINHHLLFLGMVERKYGPGSGTTAYQFIGLAVTLFSVFVLTGYIDLYGNAFGNNIGGSTRESSSPGQQIQRGNRTRIVE